MEHIVFGERVLALKKDRSGGMFELERVFFHRFANGAHRYDEDEKDDAEKELWHDGAQDFGKLFPEICNRKEELWLKEREQ